jgi:hypothetical protein
MDFKFLEPIYRRAFLAFAPSLKASQISRHTCFFVIAVESSVTRLHAESCALWPEPEFYSRVNYRFATQFFPKKAYLLQSENQ